jgi:hypothetical protein
MEINLRGATSEIGTEVEEASSNRPLSERQKIKDGLGTVSHYVILSKNTQQD